jgi:hypothetical protein
LRRGFASRETRREVAMRRTGMGDGQAKGDRDYNPEALS